MQFMLVFSSNGGMGQEATIAMKRLATMLAEKHAGRYEKTMGLLRCRFAFFLIRSSLIWLRGTEKRLFATL